MTRAPKRRKKNLDTTTRVLLVVFVVLGIVLAFIGGKFVFNLVKGWSLTSLPGAPVSSGTTNNNANTQPGIPLQSNNAPAAKAWDGKAASTSYCWVLITQSAGKVKTRAHPFQTP